MSDVLAAGLSVDLRALREDDTARLTAPEVTGEFNRLEPFDPDLVPGSVGRAAVIDKEGRLLGSVSWRTVAYGPNRGSRAWNIGVNLFPDARGHGYGAEAQRLLADHLLATTDVDRVEASTDVDNRPEQRALEKAGFTREGVLREAQFRAGARHDLVVYSRLRSDRA